MLRTATTHDGLGDEPLRLGGDGPPSPAPDSASTVDVRIHIEPERRRKLRSILVTTAVGYGHAGQNLARQEAAEVTAPAVSKTPLTPEAPKRHLR